MDKEDAKQFVQEIKLGDIVRIAIRLFPNGVKDETVGYVGEITPDLVGLTRNHPFEMQKPYSFMIFDYDRIVDYRLGEKPEAITL